VSDLVLFCEPPLSSYGVHLRALGCRRGGTEEGQRS
jgi:hypothetical protein